MKLLLLLALASASCIEETPLTVQPDDVDSGAYDDLAQQPQQSLCTRPCRGQPMVCYYKFFLEHYSAMGPACGNCSTNPKDCWRTQCVTADGFEKAILTVNRRIPGPSIQVCAGDTIVVDVHNNLGDKATTMHWHGILHRTTQCMDGVPGVSQCPILGGEVFRYNFPVPRAGSFFWHSHEALQKIDGVQGSLIVRERHDMDPQRNEYDQDLPSHVIFISDWMHTLADDRLPGLQSRNVGMLPDTYLVNGKGFFFKDPSATFPTAEMLNNQTVPLAQFTVKQSLRYRFRLIGGSCLSCAYSFSIQGHKMKLIATDGGNPVVPRVVDTVDLLSGDRFDVVVTADQPVGAYWIMVRGLGACLNTSQVAILRYQGATNTYPDSPFIQQNNLTLNVPNAMCNPSNTTALCISQLVSLNKAPQGIQSSKGKNLLVFEFGFFPYTENDLFMKDKYHRYFEPALPLLFKSVINNISNTMPASPLLTQKDGLKDICPAGGTCKKGLDPLNCRCVNLYQIPLDTYVDVVVSDSTVYSPSGLTHPFHLHGHEFAVLEMGVFPGNRKEGLNQVIKRIKAGQVTTTSPPYKDSVGVPSGGYAILRFYANNPGYWLFHCHFVFHLDMGMSAILQVGRRNQMSPAPANFPTCHDYIPPVVRFDSTGKRIS